jgi:hypothetical protein
MASSCPNYRRQGCLTLCNITETSDAVKLFREKIPQFLDENLIFFCSNPLQSPFPCWFIYVFYRFSE